MTEEEMEAKIGEYKVRGLRYMMLSSDPPHKKRERMGEMFNAVNKAEAALEKLRSIRKERDTDGPQTIR